MTSLVLLAFLISCGGGSDNGMTGTGGEQHVNGDGNDADDDTVNQTGDDNTDPPAPEGDQNGFSGVGIEFDWGEDDGVQAPEYFNGFALTSSSFNSVTFPEDNFSATFTNNSSTKTIVVSVGAASNTITLDASGRVSSNGLSRTYLYNGAGLVSQRLPDSSDEPNEQFFYDQNRLLVRHVSDFDGVTTFGYNDSGVLLDSSANCDFNIDNQSRITAINCADRSTEIDYDSNGNPIAVRVFDADGNSASTSTYTYESADGIMNLGLLGFVELDFYQIQL